MQENGVFYFYLCGNFLGLQLKYICDYIEQEFKDWVFLGVEGYIYVCNFWLFYYEFFIEYMVVIVGVKLYEVVVMNIFMVNFYLMMVLFYWFEGKCIKILIEGDVFLFDCYVVVSQLCFYGYEFVEYFIEF